MKSTESLAPSTKQLTGLEYELALLSRHYLSALAHRGGQKLDRSAYLILVRLGEHDALSLKELSEAFRLDVSTLNRQVAAMRRTGLVERVPDPEGGVARKIRATEQGRRMVRADRDTGRENVGKVVADWSETEVAQLHAMIAKFNQSIESLEDNPWPRQD
ncbi:MarR family winged helix-turn-helix transcriptional regulator [Antrihabitans sp. YC2-6]|uniref:MarR family winged helix-turn-helix transcriptional regulator n=1 Tax=Antrihabitans sp. YC2-6 TaxID=2799498 RepID=UPI0018F6A585|nr:MarR family transcriptional regulator [Antrihabitans sp. YC2-6]MBJ8347593.1 MarR family transcriptional regulator [Antrihabitans sp. YC2-6]